MVTSVPRLHVLRWPSMHWNRKQFKWEINHSRVSPWLCHCLTVLSKEPQRTHRRIYLMFEFAYSSEAYNFHFLSLGRIKYPCLIQKCNILFLPARPSHQKVDAYSGSCVGDGFLRRDLLPQWKWMNNPGVDLGLGTWHWRKPVDKKTQTLVATPYWVFNIKNIKLLALLYLGGLLAALDLIDSRLS